MKRQGTILSMAYLQPSLAWRIRHRPSESAGSCIPGNICQPFSEGSTANPTLLQRGIYGVDLGTGTASGTVWCPLPNVRDIAMPNDVWNVWMSVYDRSHTADFVRTLFRQDTNSATSFGVNAEHERQRLVPEVSQLVGPCCQPALPLRHHVRYARLWDLGILHLASITMNYPPIVSARRRVSGRNLRERRTSDSEGVRATQFDLGHGISHLRRANRLCPVASLVHTVAGKEQRYRSARPGAPREGRRSAPARGRAAPNARHAARAA